MGELQLAAGRLEEALASFESIQTAHPGHVKIPDAMFKAGIVLSKMGRGSEARVTWERCFATFPKSSAGTLAKKYLEQM